MVSDIKVGRTYRAKKPRAAGWWFGPLVNDRTVIFTNGRIVQYDGPSVATGRTYPSISVEAFIAWADHDVTDELPPGEYVSWEAFKKNK